MRTSAPEISRIAAGVGDEVCGEVFAEQLDSHVGHVFEDCTKQYMWHIITEKQLPVSFKKIGRWWGNNPKERREEEVDFIAYSEENAIFGECKWRNEPVSERVLDTLIERAKLFPGFSDICYILFSKSGFTSALEERATRQGNVTLVGVDDMFIY